MQTDTPKYKCRDTYIHKTKSNTNHEALQTGSKFTDISTPLVTLVAFAEYCSFPVEVLLDRWYFSWWDDFTDGLYCSIYHQDAHIETWNHIQIQMMTNRFKRVHLIFKISCQRGMGSLRESDFSSAKMELKKSWISDFVCKLLMFPWEVLLGQDNLGIDVTLCC